MTPTTTADVMTTVEFQRQIDETRDCRGRGDMAALTQLVHNYNHAQTMACVGIRMDPYQPCNGSFGNLCMQCPRRKGLRIEPTLLP